MRRRTLYDGLVDVSVDDRGTELVGTIGRKTRAPAADDDNDDVKLATVASVGQGRMGGRDDGGADAMGESAQGRADSGQRRDGGRVVRDGVSSVISAKGLFVCTEHGRRQARNLSWPRARKERKRPGRPLPVSAPICASSD
uniref:Uncharacterized protein n=1 Tax=Plectus sambesii TaxID=2011161 RepID=A0A914UIW2_9BILA